MFRKRRDRFSLSRVARKLIVDASIAVKWLAPEVDSERAIELSEREPLTAPTLIFAEVANALAKKMRSGQLGGAPDFEALRSGLVGVESDLSLAPHALHLATVLRHSVYDCFYLALAIKRGEQLVTADERFVVKCRAANLELPLTLDEWAR